MILSDQNRQTLLIELHRLIEEQASQLRTTIMKHPDDDHSIYPPDAILETEEIEALQNLEQSEELSKALTKVFKDFSAKIFFRFFNIIDQTLVPHPKSGNWSPVAVVDLPEGYSQKLEYLHDHFLETYWDYKALRQSKALKMGF